LSFLRFDCGSSMPGTDTSHMVVMSREMLCAVCVRW
jgi:hypothetical protein